MKALIDGPPLTKTCGRCGEIKAFEDFANSPACKFGKAGTCKECMAKNSNKHYNENKKEKLEKANIRNRKRKEKAIQFLGGVCNDCGGEFHRCVFDFHHIDGTKDMNPSKALCMSWERAVEELQKCVLLCSNCHRLRHFKEGE